jgi:serine/threonine-protein kinase RsbW
MKKISTEIASLKKNYALVESLLMKANEEFCCGDERFKNILIAVSELVMNAIVHGNKGEETKKVRVSVEYDNETMIIKILDEGNGLPYDLNPKPELPENILNESGRGMYIVNSLIKEVEVNKTDHGTEFVLTIKKKK